MRRLMATCWLLICISVAALAHKPSDSYLSIVVDDDRAQGRWDVSIRDLHHAIGLDANGDGNITWGELKAAGPRVQDHVFKRLRVESGGKTGNITPNGILVDEHTDGQYAVLEFEVRELKVASELTLEYSLFAETDPQHRGLLKLEAGEAVQTGLFGPDKPRQTFAITRPDPWRQFTSFVVEGVWHIWKGFDHILFLLSLLLPAVFIRKKDEWTGIEKFGSGAWNVLKVVTSFTLAHSITLSLAALEVIRLPSKWVECTIAASVVYAALRNVRMSRGGKGMEGWTIAFVFGLIHGFGFANVLADLELKRSQLAVGLVGFNAGVELGQLAIVLLFFPMAFALRNTRFYQKGIALWGSCLIAFLAATWLVERALGWPEFSIIRLHFGP